MLIRRVTAVALWLTLVFLPDWLGDDPLWRNSASRLVIIGSALLLAYLIERSQRRAILFGILLAALVGSTAVYVLLPIEKSAWLIVINWFAALFLLARQLHLTTFTQRGWQWAWRLVVWGSTAVIAGMGLAGITAIFSHFAEEEFFVAVSGLYLSLFWLLLAGGYHLTVAAPTPLTARITQPQWAVLASLGSGAIIALLAIPWGLAQYQRSFFPLTAPTYPGIGEASPFLCEQLNEPAQPIPAATTTATLVSLLQANPNKDTLSWGSLALYSGDADAADAFRRHLLQDAAQNLYTAPAHSIKWGQYEAALRLNQLELINAAFPDLFSAADWQSLRAWFAQINRRAMTVEWVDWLYAAAYDIRPQGPYENQEIGAGFLAALMNNGLAADDLAAANAAYLNQTPLGWDMIFRNTDDSYSYQNVWLANAWWVDRYRRQTGAAGAAAQRNQELSLLWALILSLPDGVTLSYNVEWEAPMLTTYLFGAALLANPELSWLAGKTVQRLAQEGKVVWGGLVITPPTLPDGRSPDIGSCLVFGSSGVPTTKGPLAPDKVVLRDGWADDALYALLNLRFTGWHRYKATNTLPLLYQDGPLVSERWTAERFWWMPAGRGAFRDKRAPREYLNGLLLPKSGLPDLLWRMTGIGGPWAQDPPPYAAVDAFFTSSALDMSTTTIADWHGWQHARTIYQVDDGLVFVVDQAAAANAARPASLIWHVNGRGLRQENGLSLDSDERPAAAVWPAADDAFISLQALPPGDAYLRSPDWEFLYTSPLDGELKTAIAFLTKTYTQGEMNVTYVGERQGVLAEWATDGRSTTLLHNFNGSYLQSDGLGTDGTMVALLHTATETQLCYAGGQTVRARLTGLARPLSLSDGAAALDPTLWQLDGDWLQLTAPDTTHAACLYLLP